MSLMDKIKAFFSGGSAEHDHDHADHDHEQGSTYLQTPSDPDQPVAAPTPEEIAAAAQAEPPTTTVDGLSDEEHRDEVH
jgi:hypothetical protein